MDTHGDTMSIGVRKSVDHLYGFIVEINDHRRTRTSGVGVGVLRVEARRIPIGIQDAVGSVLALRQDVEVVALQTFHLRIGEIERVASVEIRLTLLDAGDTCVKAWDVTERAHAIDVEVSVLILEDRLVIDRAGWSADAERRVADPFDETIVRDIVERHLDRILHRHPLRVVLFQGDVENVVADIQRTRIGGDALVVEGCPPTLPVIVGITDEPLVDALKNALPLAETNEKNKRIIYESSEGGVVVQDVPVSFSQLHRIHGYRYKKEEMITMVGVKEEKSITIAEHDPMAEL